MCCKKCRDHYVRKNLPTDLMSIWGDPNSPIREPNFLPADKKLRNMERHMYVSAEGRKIQGDWQDMIESGMMGAADDWGTYANPVFEQTDDEDEEDGNRLWAFQANAEGEFEFVNAAFLAHAADEPDGEGNKETTFDEAHSDGEEAEKVSEKKEGVEDEGSSSGEGETDEEGSASGSEEEGSGSSGEETSDKETSGSEGEEGSEKGIEEGSDKEEEASKEDTEDTTSSEDVSVTAALLPQAASVEEDEPPTVPPPMSQEEMDRAMQELEQTEQAIASDALLGWDDIENLLFNQWADVQGLDDEDHSKLL